MSQLDIKIRKLQDNGSTFRANIETLYLGGVRSAKVDELRFELPEEWKNCTVTLHVQRLSGTKPDPQLLDEQNSALVDRRWTLEKEGTWMLLAINDSGYIAMTKPGKYTCYDTIDTDTTTENITPSIYEQFVAEVTKYAKQALESMNAAKASETNAKTSETNAKASADKAKASADSMDTSVATCTTKAGEASTSAGAAFNSRQAAEKAQKAAEDAAALAGTRAGTDKTLKVEDAPADAAATGAALDKKANKDIVLGPDGNAIFYSKAEVEAKIKEILAAQREEDLARIKFWASDDPTSPASFIGGTWERIENRFIMGASDTYPAGSTGGSASHYHDYKISFSWNNGAVVGYHQSAISPYNYQTGKYYISAGDNDKIGEGYTLVNTAASDASGERKSTNFATYGSTSSSDTLNPYYSVYIWVRVDDAA